MDENNSKIAFPVGLDSNISISFLQDVQRTLDADAARAAAAAKSFKASNIYATKITIGQWENEAEYRGDIVVKFCYGSQVFVWEITNRKLGVKHKLKIRWTEVFALRATKIDNEEILEIELTKAPEMFKEIESRSGIRMRDIWSRSEDFTDGSARNIRKHCIKFYLGVLRRHYERLLKCPDMAKLSQKPFLSPESPYLDSPCQFFLSRIKASKETNTASSVLDFASSSENISSGLLNDANVSERNIAAMEENQSPICRTGGAGTIMNSIPQVNLGFSGSNNQWLSTEEAVSPFLIYDQAMQINPTHSYPNNQFPSTGGVMTSVLGNNQAPTASSVQMNTSFCPNNQFPSTMAPFLGNHQVPMASSVQMNPTSYYPNNQFPSAEGVMAAVLGNHQVHMSSTLQMNPTSGREVIPASGCNQAPMASTLQVNPTYYNPNDQFPSTGEVMTPASGCNASYLQVNTEFSHPSNQLLSIEQVTPLALIHDQVIGSDSVSPTAQLNENYASISGSLNLFPTLLEAPLIDYSRYSMNQVLPDVDFAELGELRNFNR